MMNNTDTEELESEEPQSEELESEELEPDELEPDEEELNEAILINPLVEVKGESRLPATFTQTTKSVGIRDPLHLYLKEIARFPLLDPDEEYRLAKRVQDENDQEAAFRLVSSHLRLVVKIAMDFQRRWRQNALDLIQEGNVGLMKAVQRFDPEKGIKFSYYSAFWIKAYILKFIMDNWRLVKIGTTQTQRKLFYNLNKERQRLLTLGFNPTTEALSENLNVSREDIEEMDQRLAKNDLSLNTPLGEDSDTTRMDFIPSVGPGIEESLATGQMVDLLLGKLKEIAPLLNDKEQAILEHRLLSDDPVTLREIGEQFGVTRERVRQIEARLLVKIREFMTDNIQDFSEDWILEHE